MKKPAYIAKKIWDKFDDNGKKLFVEFYKEFKQELDIGAKCKGYDDTIRASNLAVLTVWKLERCIESKKVVR